MTPVSAIVTATANMTANMTTDADELRAYSNSSDAVAFERLVRRHIDMVYSLCLRELHGDSHLAEDSTQAVFILLAQKAGRLPAQGSLAGWLYQAAKYCCRNARRSGQRRTRHEMEAAAQRPETMQQPSDSPSDAMERDELAQSVHAGLARLHGGEREAVLLRYFQQMTLRQVGDALGVSEEAAKQRIARAVRKLGRILGATTTGSATSAAAIPAWLDAHAICASPAALTQAAAHTAAHGITAATAAPLAIAKAAAASWTQAKLIAGGVIVAAMAAVVGATSVGWHYLAHPANPPATVAAAAPLDRGPGAPPTPVVISPATAPAIDLSTPLGSFRAFSERLKALDIDGMNDLLVDDSSEGAQMIHHDLRVEVAQHRLTRAMTDAFGKDVTPVKFTDFTIDQVMDMLLALPGGLDVTEVGNTATVTMHLPSVVKQIPDIASWDGMTLTLMRDSAGKPWKFKLDDLLDYDVTTPGGERRRGKPSEIIPFLDAVVEAADKTAAEVQSGLISNPADAGKRFSELMASKKLAVIGTTTVPRRSTTTKEAAH